MSKQMHTIQVSFSKRYVEGYDRLYTYKIECEKKDLYVGRMIYVESPEGIKRAQIIIVDKEFNIKAEKRFGALSWAYLEMPKVERVSKL